MDPTGHMVLCGVQCEEGGGGFVDSSGKFSSYGISPGRQCLTCNTPASISSAELDNGLPTGGGLLNNATVSTRQVIQQLINHQRYDAAITLAVRAYHIDTHGVTPRFDATMAAGDGEGVTIRYPDGTITMGIGIDAFSSSGWLASSIGHEGVHVDQHGSGRAYDDSTFPPGIRPVYAAINEVEAYDWELSHAVQNGLSPDKVADLQRRRDYYADIVSKLDEFLHLDLREGVDRGNYTFPQLPMLPPAP